MSLCTHCGMENYGGGMDPSDKSETYDGEALLDFVQHKMSMSSYYQPLVIKTLIEGGGQISKEDLAKTFLLADDFAMRRSRRIVMRWPYITLRGRGSSATRRPSRSSPCPWSSQAVNNATKCWRRQSTDCSPSVPPDDPASLSLTTIGARGRPS